MITCDRCGSESQATIMSMFNTQVICMTCKSREQAHPDYNKAREAEREAVLAGIRNFDGIGLPKDL